MTIASKESPPDLAKTLGDWALAAGRYFQSPQTGYVHHYYGENQPGSQTIPLVENALFVLALLRSRLVEQVQEAKGLLKKLLAFQNRQQDDSTGNFPVYLHEYPLCQDSTVGLQLLASFYWILKHFGHILGADLKQQLEQASQLALEHSLRFDALKPFPYSFAVRLAAAQLSYGILWEQVTWQQEGTEKLEQLAQRQLEGWQTTKHLGDLLVGLQMVYSSLSNSQWNPLWQRMNQTWHDQTGCYVGPCVREWQEREEPQTNLYDLYAGYFAGQFSRRASLLRAYHLHGALIRPFSDKFDLKLCSLSVKGEFKQQAWQTVRAQEWAYTLLEKKEPYNPSQDKTYTPFRLIWGDLHVVHSFVCQGGEYEKVEYVEEGDSLKLFFDLREASSDGERPPQREIEFFVDFHPDLLFTLNGQSANTFELGQTLTFSFSHYRLSLEFKLIQGEGTFLGHLMRGNRPSQVDHKGDKRFQAYDWTCFLRTIRRQSRCRLQVTLSWQSVEMV